MSSCFAIAQSLNMQCMKDLVLHVAFNAFKIRAFKTSLTYNPAEYIFTAPGRNYCSVCKMVDSGVASGRSAVMLFRPSAEGPRQLGGSGSMLPPENF